MNNYNPYGNFPYNSYSQNNYSPYPTYSSQAVQQYQQPIVYPLTYTNGVIGAKAFPMQQPNSTVYLLDSDTPNVIYEKKADQQGRCMLKAYSMSEISLEDITNNIIQDKSTKSITKEDIEKLEQSFNNALNNIKKSIEELKYEQSNANVNAINANGE